MAGLESSVEDADQIGTKGFPQCLVKFHWEAIRTWGFTLRHTLESFKTLIKSQVAFAATSLGRTQTTMYPASRASFSFLLGAARAKENDTLPKLCSFSEVAVTQELGRNKLVYCCINSCFTGFNAHALFLRMIADIQVSPRCDLIHLLFSNQYSKCL